MAASSSSKEEEKKSISREQLKILTLNTYLRPPGIASNFWTQDSKDTRLLLIIKYICESDYDVVCLQEIYGTLTGRRKKLQRRCLAHYPYCVVSENTFWTQPVDAGLMILSKHPMILLEEKQFPSHSLRLSDRFSSKGALFVSVNPTPEVEWIICNTHVQACYDPRTDLPLIDWHLKLCLKWALKYEERSHGILLVGDLNADFHLHAALKETMSPHESCSQCMGATKTYSTTHPSETFDYIIPLNPDCRVVSARTIHELPTLSDHYAVEATVQSSKASTSEVDC